ncbi:MAG TPA: hypothetical protein VLX28_19330, partial [Thermoanaerobaculia bacterium]|nr:hypothetical protein [Thermoanaerobaculia bacterium]
MSERIITKAPTESKPRQEPSSGGMDLVAELRSTLERAGELIRVVESNLEGTPEKVESILKSERVNELERRLATAESDVKELASRLVDSEHQG